MQQYFDIEEGSGILTVFHTENTVGMNVEHYGGFSVSSDELLQFLKNNNTTLEITTNPAEEHPELADKRPELYPDTDQYKGTITKTQDDGLQIQINGDQKDITLHLTPEQTQTLQESITVGTVERYADGQYPVESVNKEGVRNRARH